MNELNEKAISEPTSDYAIKAESRYEVSEGRGNSDMGGAMLSSSENRSFPSRPEVVDESMEISEPANIKDIRIVSLNSGFLVKVGCQSLAVEKTETLLARLNDYLTNPYGFEKKWFSTNNRNKLDNF